MFHQNSQYARSYRENECFFLNRSKCSTLIFGGEKAEIGEFPWQISQRRGTVGSPGSHMCGGSIGSEKYIITAAHCKYNPNLIIIAYG